MMIMMMTALVFVSGFTLGSLLNEMKDSRLSRPCISKLLLYAAGRRQFKWTTVS